MEIKRIKRIQNYRIFHNWKMGRGDRDFDRFNVIYGGNGSGKSTLAALFKEVSTGDWSSGVTLKVSNPDTQTAREITGPDDMLAKHLFIFNADYIAKNLRFDTGETESLVFLGEKSVDDQKQRDKLSADIKKLNDSILQLETDVKTLIKKRDKIATEGARKIVEKLQGIDGRKYGGKRFQRPQFVESLRSVDHCDMSDFDVDQQIKHVASPPGEKISLLDNIPVPLIELADQVNSVLSQTVTSEAIQSLKERQDGATGWVQQGMRLHKAGDRCLFCDGEYTQDRIDRLNRHFDDSLRKAQDTIRTLDGKIGGYLEEYEQFSKSIEPPRPLNEARTKQWIECLMAVRSEVKTRTDFLSFLRKELARKDDALFDSLTLAEYQADVSHFTNNIDISALHDIVHAHNSDVNNYDQLKAAVCDKIVQYYVLNVRDEYLEKDKEIKDFDTKINEFKSERTEKQRLLQELQNSQQNYAHFATILTTDMKNYFGRDELTFEFIGNAYSIKRNGERAEHLSEGERRSIALLYFLRDLESNDAKLREHMVIFDDPVSSVDDDAATGAFAYIWDKCIGKKQAGVGQLFVFTHNFEFFRRWVNRLDSLKRLSHEENNLVSYSVRELRVNMTSESGRTVRVPYFVYWDKSWKYSLLRSEYHYLFWRAATELERWKKCSNDATSQYDAAILPNVCRRLLEGFFSFRCPQGIGNFEEQMKQVLDERHNTATRNYLVRFLHEYSHNEQCDLNKSIQLLETPKIVESVFLIIRDLDERHYKAMSDALKVCPLDDSPTIAGELVSDYCTES